MYMASILVLCGRDHPDGIFNEMRINEMKDILGWPKRPGAKAVVDALICTEFVSRMSGTCKLRVSNWSAKQPSVVKRIREQNSYDDNKQPDATIILPDSAQKNTDLSIPIPIPIKKQKHIVENGVSDDTKIIPINLFDYYCETNLRNGKPLPQPRAFASSWKAKCKTRSTEFNRKPTAFADWKMAIDIITERPHIITWEWRPHFLWFIENDSNYLLIFDYDQRYQLAKRTPVGKPYVPPTPEQIRTQKIRDALPKLEIELNIFLEKSGGGILGPYMSLAHYKATWDPEIWNQLIKLAGV